MRIDALPNDLAQHAEAIPRLADCRERAQLDEAEVQRQQHVPRRRNKHLAKPWRRGRALDVGAVAARPSIARLGVVA